MNRPLTYATLILSMVFLVAYFPFTNAVFPLDVSYQEYFSDKGVGPVIRLESSNRVDVDCVTPCQYAEVVFLGNLVVNVLSWSMFFIVYRRKI